jgi:Zn-dependent protease
MLRDPLSWSLPLGRLFGINVRVHILFPIVALGLILRVAFQKEPTTPPPGTWTDMAVILLLLFVSVLLHEFGHCFGGRWMEGDAHDILMWPLGGLAYVEVPHTPRAHFVTALSGPLVNLLLCVVCAVVLIVGFSYWPPLNPFPGSESGFPWRVDGTGAVQLYAWGGSGGLKLVQNEGWGVATVLVARLFFVNWLLLLLNVVLIGFPMDGGRMFQAFLWRFVGYRQATLVAIFAGFLTMFVVGLFAIIMNELLPLCLAAFIYVACRQEWVMLESGGEEGPFGYDFSQGYTSLERDQAAAAPPRRKQNWWQRWQQRRTARKMQREQEVREAEERRMDELLAKVQRDGITALTDEERRFLKRVSDRYRNRQ